MPIQPKPDEKRVIEATEAARGQKKPNLSKIAREYGVPYNTLRRRVSGLNRPQTAQKPVNKVLAPFQEKALAQWLSQMRDRYLPVPPTLLESMANASLRRTGSERTVSKMWPYRFIKRLPKDLKLAPMKQRTKEYKRIQAENSGLLELWYTRWKQAIDDTPARLVYNVDECGFQPGQGKDRNVVGGSSVPDLAKAERGETITAVECISADGWQMDPMFIFKGTTFMETWYNDSEALPPRTLTAVSPNGWISDELAVEWLYHFHHSTCMSSRLNRGEKRILLFDGHGAHLTEEFLQKCEDYKIIPFAFEAHTTHLAQPLDGKPFLSYKQHFRKENNELAFYAGEPVRKADFLRMIGNVRKQAFNSRIIREAFKKRGIWPPDGSDIVERLATSQPELPDLAAPDLRPYGERTPSPPPTNLSSSSVENTPPKSIQALEKNQKKLSKIAGLTPKDQRNLQRVFEHNKIVAEHAELSNTILARMQAARTPLQRVYTKRHIKPLSQSGVLGVRDANRSIVKRKAAETAKEEKRLAKQYQKVHGKPPPKVPTQESEASVEAARVAQAAGEFFYMDSTPMR